jgi:hypothetical protein
MNPKILVGYDGSDRARDALVLARGLPEPVGAELLVACVYAYQPLSSRIGTTEFGDGRDSSSRAASRTRSERARRPSGRRPPSTAEPECRGSPPSLR